jgi:hypothetical protein
MRLTETWIQATFVTIALVATLGFQPSREMTLCKAFKLGWKIGKHLPPGVEVDSAQLGLIMKDAVVQDPALLNNDEHFSAKLKEECSKLVEANRLTCGHDQSFAVKMKKGRNVCSQCLADALARATWQ